MKQSRRKSQESSVENSCTRMSELNVSSVSEDNRTIDLMFSTGAERDLPWYANPLGTMEPIREILEISKEAMDTARLEKGAAFVIDHGRSIDSQHGVIEKAWVSNGKAYATVRFSKDQRTDRLWNDIKDGIIRNISFGYSILDYEIVESEERGELDTLLITRFQPYEISAVAIPADSEADFLRSLPHYQEIIRNNHRSKVMSKKTEAKKETTIKDEKPATMVDSKPEAKVDALSERSDVAVQRKEEKPKGPSAEEIAKAERNRVSEIMELCSRCDIEAEKQASFVRDGISIDEVRKEILDMQYKRTNSDKPTHSSISVGETDGQKRMAAMENAVLNRLDAGRTKLLDSNHYRSASLFDMANECLRAQNVNTGLMGRRQIVREALSMTRSGSHSSSDFPSLLANVNNKQLLQNYEAQTAYQTFQPLVTTVTVPDFKEISFLRIGENPDFEESGEGQELKYGSISEERETVKIRKFRKGISFTEEMIINDDLNAFRQVGQFGAAAARVDSEVVYDSIISNPTMGDGIALFATAHNNLDGTAAAVNESSLDKAVTAMTLQKALDSNRPLRIRPRYIIHAPSRRLEVMKQLAEIAPETSANVNVFSGMFVSIEEPLLAGSTAWYMMADPAAGMELLALIRMQGMVGPEIEQKVDFDSDCIKIKAKHYVAAKPLDYRGFWKNPGT